MDSACLLSVALFDFLVVPINVQPDRAGKGQHLWLLAIGMLCRSLKDTFPGQDLGFRCASWCEKSLFPLPLVDDPSVVKLLLLLGRHCTEIRFWTVLWCRCEMSLTGPKVRTVGPQRVVVLEG